VSLTARAVYRTAFMKAVGQPEVNVAATTKCSAGETFYEIALVFDTTGSMAQSSGSVSKMESARKAGAKFVDFMFAEALPDHVKMSVVPFAASVAVPVASKSAEWFDAYGSSPHHWQNLVVVPTDGFKSRLDVFAKLRTFESTWDWKGCVESLPYPFNTTADQPNAVGGLVVPMFAPDEAGNTLEDKYLDSAGRASNNTYMDDGPSTSGKCQSDDSDITKRFSQACKYKDPKHRRTSPTLGPGSQCTSRPLTRLTGTKDTITKEISALEPEGSTNIHEGLVWGWRTLSSDSYFKDGAPSTRPGTIKIIVLMTDGMNQWNTDSGNKVNKSLYSAYGYLRNGDGSGPNTRLPPANANPDTGTKTRNAIDALVRETCTNARGKGIQIYTVGFSTPKDQIDAEGLKLLADCAGQSDRSFVATDENSIVTSFQDIAKGISQLKIVE
jgi:hypothetical protein